MKIFISTLITLGLLSANAFAQVAETPRFACSLNKSVELWIIERQEDGNSPASLVLTKKLWNAEPEEIAVLNNASFVTYGNVYVALADAGRSGYALIRVEREEKDGNVSYRGNLDINLFDLQSSHPDLQTNGLRSLGCRELE